MMTRRYFLGAATCAAAAGGLGLGDALLPRRWTAATGLDAEALGRLRGQPVLLTAPDGRTLQASVSEVSTRRRRSEAGAPATEQISICLAAGNGQTAAGIYRLRSDSLILGDLFLVPVDREGADRRLEAVITRFV